MGSPIPGLVVADGVYTVRLHAVGANGQTADASVQLGVDTRTPGSLTRPSPGDTLSGSAGWVVYAALRLGQSLASTSIVARPAAAIP